MPPFARLLPYWATRVVETSAGPLTCLFLVDGTVVVGWEVRGRDIYAADHAALNSCASGLRRALNTLPANAFLQIDWRTGLFFNDLVDGFARRGGAGGSAIFAEQRKARAEMLRKDGSLRRGRHVFWLGVRDALGKLAAVGTGVSLVETITGFLSGVPTKARDGITKDDVAGAAQTVAEVAARMRGELEGIGLSFSALDENAIVNELFTALNPLSAAGVDPPRIVDESLVDKSTYKQPGYEVYRPFSLREQLPMGDLVWDVSHFTLDDPPVLHRVLSVQSLPPRTIAGAFARVAQFASATPFRLVTSFEATDNEKIKAQLIRKRNINQSFTQGGPRDIASETNVQQIETAIERMERNDQRLFKVSVHAVLLGADVAELDQATTDLKDEFAQRLGTTLTVETGRQRDAFLATLPGNCAKAPRVFTMLTDNAADFMPYHQPRLGDADPQLLYHTREGGLRKLSFSAARPNSNALVIGGSGSGKSFNVATIFELAALAEGGPVFIIDVQGQKVSNYRVLCELFGGSYTALQGNHEISFNPFFAYEDLFARDEVTLDYKRNAEGRRYFDEEKLGFLATLVSIMAVRDIATNPQKNLYESIALKCINAAYKTVQLAKKDRPPLLRDVVDELGRFDSSQPELKALARQMQLQLETWVTHPTRSRLLDRPSSFKTDSKLVVFDFFGIDQDPDLATVLLLSVSFYLWNEMSKFGRDKTKVVIFDECWQLMGHPTAAKLVEALYRTGRKWGISTWAISQTIDDFVNTGIGAKLIANAATILLNRHTDGHEKVAEMMDLNARGLELFKSLRFKRGSYSDILLIDKSVQPQETSIIVNKPTAFDYWINTTNAADVGLRDRVEKELKLSRLEAIRYCAQRFPNGAPPDAPTSLPAAASPVRAAS